MEPLPCLGVFLEPPHKMCAFYVKFKSNYFNTKLISWSVTSLCAAGRQATHLRRRWMTSRRRHRAAAAMTSSPPIGRAWRQYRTWRHRMASAVRHPPRHPLIAHTAERSINKIYYNTTTAVAATTTTTNTSCSCCTVPLFQNHSR